MPYYARVTFLTLRTEKSILLSTISVVVPTKLVDNKRIGPDFVAQMYRENTELPMGQPYGTFLRDSQWRVLVIKNNMVVFGENGRTAETIGDHLPKLPSCIVLVDPDDAKTVMLLLKQAGHTVEEFSYPGTLMTQGR